MKRLQLDFCSEQRASPWAGRVLLAVAAAVCLDVGLSFNHAKESVKAVETSLAQRTPGGRASKATPQEVAAARETVQRLSLPWNGLFRAIEAAANDEVVLTAIEPDARAGMVTIKGEGKSYLSALSYVSNLSRVEGLERVQLVRHEQKANDPNGAVSFSVSAAWSTQ
jgi:hypothetical protein